MNLLADLSYHLVYLYKFGALFLFLALVLGIVGLPIPDEVLLIISGYLVAHNKLHMATTIIAAFSGSILGITISYFLGRLVGKWVIKKYGKTFRITEEKMNLTQSWFQKIGKWILIIGYFLPFLRHLFGFVAGGAKLDYRVFALFAYSGAIIWSTTFLSLGYFFHDLAKNFIHTR